nr:hypothetical protein [Kibdelosporangium sp. MJ126-NF4]CEL21541.1 hypothetical protein [Kibdelosporangium sp. MJ126-NF4]CTQ95892.1 hypothetical protein [Kibdelosporangium sp. MJ126-NF4]
MVTAGESVALGIESRVTKLENESKNEGVPIFGHVIEGMGNVGGSDTSTTDPVASLFSAGVGWLVDSIGFIREPIDKLQGNPAAIQADVDRLMKVAEDLKFLARDQRDDITSLQDWTGGAADAYRSSMKLLREEIAGLSKAVGGFGTLLAVSGGMVITLRQVVRDLIVNTISDLIPGAIAAIAMAFWTFGASIAIFIAAAVIAAVTTVIKCTRRIVMLKEALGRQVGRLGTLEEISGDIVTSLARFEKAVGGKGMSPA